MAGLTAGALAKQSGVNFQSIRFYEHEGLLPKPHRTHSGYRVFPADAVGRIRFIKATQKLGFALKEIKGLLELRTDPHASCGAVGQRVVAKLTDIDSKISDLQRTKQALAKLAEACLGRGTIADCPILKILDSGNPTPRRRPKDRSR
jgi:DNA-binding transcriptional MerR regulator